MHRSVLVLRLSFALPYAPGNAYLCGAELCRTVEAVGVPAWRSSAAWHCRHDVQLAISCTPSSLVSLHEPSGRTRQQDCPASDRELKNACLLLLAFISNSGARCGPAVAVPPILCLTLRRCSLSVAVPCRCLWVFSHSSLTGTTLLPSHTYFSVRLPARKQQLKPSTQRGGAETVQCWLAYLFSGSQAEFAPAPALPTLAACCPALICTLGWLRHSRRAMKEDCGA